MARRRWKHGILALLAVAACVVLGGSVYFNSQLAAAKVDLQDERPSVAESRLARCLRIWPWSSEAHAMMARAARLQNKTAQAEYHLNRCLKLDGGATELVQIEFLLIRVQHGEIDTLATTLFSLVEKPEGHPETIPILFTMAKAYSERLRYRPAYACLTKWIEIDASRTRPFEWRGWVLERMSNETAAMKDYQKALEINPKLIDIRLRVAEMYLENKQAPEALPHAEYLMQLAPNDPRVQARLGMCKFLLGEANDARRLMEAGEAHLPNDASLLVTIANLDLQDGKAADAERRLRQVLADDPSDTEAMFVLSRALQQQGKSEEAARVLKESQEKRKIVDRIHDLLKEAADKPNSRSDDYAEIGELFFQIGRDKFAIYWLEQALERNANNLRVHRTLAEYYTKKGDAQSAAVHLRYLPKSSP